MTTFHPVFKLSRHSTHLNGSYQKPHAAGSQPAPISRICARTAKKILVNQRVLAENPRVTPLDMTSGNPTNKYCCAIKIHEHTRRTTRQSSDPARPLQHCPAARLQSCVRCERRNKIWSGAFSHCHSVGRSRWRWISLPDRTPKGREGDAASFMLFFWLLSRRDFAFLYACIFSTSFPPLDTVSVR